MGMDKDSRWIRGLSRDPCDPYGHYNHDAEARKQLGDAFEDEPGATWGRID